MERTDNWPMSLCNSAISLSSPNILMRLNFLSFVLKSDFKSFNPILTLNIHASPSISSTMQNHQSRLRLDWKDESAKHLVCLNRILTPFVSPNFLAKFLIIYKDLKLKNHFTTKCIYFFGAHMSNSHWTFVTTGQQQKGSSNQSLNWSFSLFRPYEH